MSVKPSGRPLARLARVTLGSQQNSPSEGFALGAVQREVYGFWKDGGKILALGSESVGRVNLGQTLCIGEQHFTLL